MTIPEVLRLRRFRVEKIIWETPLVYTMRLVPCEGETMFVFRAGQWVYLHLLEPDGTSWGKAAFSIANAPDAAREGFEFGIKVAGELTKRASHLREGDVVGVQGPFGVFVLPPELPKALTFFAAGIGISPLRSMIQSLSHHTFPIPVHLFYSNRTAEDIAYAEEFRLLDRHHANFRCIFTLTKDVPHGWPGERGRIDGPMLDRSLDDFPSQRFFMCGPVPFMQNIRELLAERGVEVKKYLHQELFG